MNENGASITSKSPVGKILKSREKKGKSRAYKRSVRTIHNGERVGSWRENKLGGKRKPGVFDDGRPVGDHCDVGACRTVSAGRVRVEDRHTVRKAH